MHLTDCFEDVSQDFNPVGNADLLTVVSDRIARAFNRPGATRAVALDFSITIPRCYKDVLCQQFLSSHG